MESGKRKAESTKFKAHLIHGFDLIITALDRPSTRYEINKVSNASKPILWLDIGNGSSDGQCLLGEIGLNKELPNICDLYDYSELEDKDALKKSCSVEESLNRQDLGINQLGARLGAQILWNLFRHGSIENHGAYFSTDLSSYPIPVNEKYWSTFGYKSKNDNF